LDPLALEVSFKAPSPGLELLLDVMMMDAGFWVWVCDVIGRGLMLIFWTSDIANLALSICTDMFK
jgi:hypothetical protein